MTASSANGSQNGTATATAAPVANKTPPAALHAVECS